MLHGREAAKSHGTQPWYCLPGDRDCCFNLHLVHGTPLTSAARKNDSTLKRNRCKWDEVIEGDTNSARTSPKYVREPRNQLARSKGLQAGDSFLPAAAAVTL